MRTLHDLKSRGSDRISPLESPKMRKPVARCQTCSIDFISKDVLDTHTSQYHRVQNSASESNRPKNNNSVQHEKVQVNSIPVVARDAQSRPDGSKIRRQYNCHECDFQTNKSKLLYNHSVKSGHRKIDSLMETCFSCNETFENFIVLMKHRKSAHYDIINECHGFKAGNCKFGEHCYYKHPGDQAKSKTISNDSFHQGLSEFPPDLKELTLGFQTLMLTFLSRREGFRGRLSGQ